VSDVTQILSRIESGDPKAAEQLLPLVYDELRKLAAGRLAQEKPGQTLQATALVHDAYIRLVDVEQTQHWDSRGHFFAAAAEAMRRILVESARRKRSLKQGGAGARVELDFDVPSLDEGKHDLLAIDEVLEELRQVAPEKAALVKLRFFAGLSEAEAAAAMQISRATASRHWTYAKAWLFVRLRERENVEEPRNP
jgi:RNA polymerase sigma factor (TIGR02999 family)